MSILYHPFDNGLYPPIRKMEYFLYEVSLQKYNSVFSKEKVYDCKNSSINETLNLPNDNSELVRVCQTEYLLSKAGPAQGNH